MTAHQYTNHWLGKVSDALTPDDWSPTDGDELDDLIDTWSDLDQLHRELGVIRDDWANALADRIQDLPYNRREGLTSSAGNTVHHDTVRTYHTDGQAIIRALANEYVDPVTGEVASAVPVEALLETIQGVQRRDGEAGTSSKWNTEPLRRWDVDVDEVREVAKRKTVIRPGAAKR